MTGNSDVFILSVTSTALTRTQATAGFCCSELYDVAIVRKISGKIRVTDRLMPVLKNYVPSTFRICHRPSESALM